MRLREFRTQGGHRDADTARTHREWWTSFLQDDVRSFLARLMGGDAKAERRQVDAGKHRFASPEHDRRNRKVNLVDEAGLKILPHRADAAADLDVLRSRRGFGLRQ